jgi:hypothetical protein
MGRFALEWEAPYLVALAASAVAYVAIAYLRPNAQPKRAGEA